MDWSGVEREFEDSPYSALKSAVADAVIGGADADPAAVSRDPLR